jgi:phosphoribosyl 1,2-cyclic phosphodiesterase
MLFNELADCALSSSADEATEQTRALFRDKCNVSKRAIIGDPKTNKDYRNNPSLLIAHYDEEDDRIKHVIIDVGKTFRETSLRWFPKYGVSSISAIVLSHEHADASMGLDDIRGYQLHAAPGTKESPPRTIPMKVFLSQPCLNTLSSMYPWLFPAQQEPAKPDPSKPEVKRFVSSLDLHVFGSFETINVAGLPVKTLPVMHGEDFLSYGFAFTVGQTNVVYLSDISRMLPETLDYIQNTLPPTDILIVDSLHATGGHPVHYSMESAIGLMKQIEPKQTYFVGLNCDSFPPHVELNKILQENYGNAQVAYDGLCIEC